MIIRTADLVVSLSDDDGIPTEGYRYDIQSDHPNQIDIIIKNKIYGEYNDQIDHRIINYLESGFQFYVQLLRYNGMMLHASAVAYGGRAYLFSGPCGTGKSTHTRLWKQVFGDDAKVFNDDKPALRRLDDRWFAYGTPWCGKDGINLNMKVPIAGICFLKQGKENRIRRLTAMEAAASVLGQTMIKLKLVENMDFLISAVDKLIREIPIFEFENIPVPEAARLSYETMRRAAEEEGL